MTKYTQHKINDAKRAHKFQNCIGLTTIGIIQVIDTKMMLNYPVTRQSVKDTLVIFFPSAVVLKGKAACDGQDYVYVHDKVIILIPPNIITVHKTMIVKYSQY